MMKKMMCILCALAVMAALPGLAVEPVGTENP